jgi:hypothetical protein
MKVNLINKYKELWKNSLKSELPDGWLYKYENLSHYRQNWDLSELDLKKMYADSFSSQVSGRLWGGTVDSPRSVMLSFIEINKEFVRSMFRDLYSQDKDLSMRVNRFSFHCDQMLDQLQKENDKIDRHYHETPQMPFLYLCFDSPESFPLYDYHAYSKALKLFETTSIPEPFEIERFYKLSKAIYTIIKKDDVLIEMIQSLIPESYGIQVNYLILDDFFQFCKNCTDSA